MIKHQKIVLFSLLYFFATALVLNATASKAAAVEKTDEPKPQTRTGNLIELNFQNASLASVLDYLAQEKGLNLIPPGKEVADKKVSLTTKQPMDLNQAWDALNTLLEIHGFRLVKFGELHRVMPIKDASTEIMSVYSTSNGDNWRSMPDSGQIVTFIYYLNNMKADQASSVINALTGEKPILFSDLDLCIMKGASYKIKNAMEILEPFDKDQLKQTLTIIKLKHTSPDTVAKLIQEEMSGNKGSEQGRVRFISNTKKDVAFIPANVRLIPDIQHNALILLGQEKPVAKIKDFIEKVIDVEWGGEKTRIRIKEINYRSADQLQRTLDKIIKSTNQASQGKQLAFKDVKIVAETTQGADAGFGNGNRLIISCDPLDWPKINSLIENLDNLKPQIALEVMIVDASLELTRALEGHIRDTGYGILGDKVNWSINNIADNGDITTGFNSLSGAIGAAIEGKTGDSLLTFGDSTKPNASGLWGLLRAAFRESNSNIITQPFLVVNNGEECYFSDQENQRVDGELSGRGNSAVVKKESIPATNSITLQPRINADGIVEMTLNITVEEFTPVLNQPPNTQKRGLKTKISMAIGEVLILGGLTKRRKNNEKHDTPIFSEIPIIGNFLKSKKKTENTESLFVFIRPSLIKPRNQAEPDDYTQFKLDYAKLNIKRTDDFAKEKDPINKLFFKPTNMSVAQAEADSRSETYPPIDDFAKRKKLPLITDIRKDKYYRVQNLSSDLQDFKQPPNKKVRNQQLLALKKRNLLEDDFEE